MEEDTGKIAAILSLNWPPSVNRYMYWTGAAWRWTSKATRFRRDTMLLAKQVMKKPFEGRIRLTLDAYPPDNRVRDIDNILKVTIDCLQGIAFLNDSQIDEIHITRRYVDPPGHLTVNVEKINLDLTCNQPTHAKK